MNSKFLTLGLLAMTIGLTACNNDKCEVETPQETKEVKLNRELKAAKLDRVHFRFNKAVLEHSKGNKKLDDDALASLDDQANFLNKNGVTSVLITGKTDERGTEEYNLALGENRARFVEKILNQKGITNTTIKSTGKAEPEVPGASNEMQHAQNRVAITEVLH